MAGRSWTVLSSLTNWPSTSDSSIRLRSTSRAEPSRERRETLVMVRRRHRSQAGQVTNRTKDCEYLTAEMSCGRRQEPATSRTVVSLADALGHRPLAPCWVKLGDAVLREGGGRREIGDIGHVNVDSPGVARHSAGRRGSLLRGVAIPLCPRRCLRVAQVETPNDSAGLPSAVCRLGSPHERITAAADDPPPSALDGDSCSGQLDQENESFSSSATSLEACTA